MVASCHSHRVTYKIYRAYMLCTSKTAIKWERTLRINHLAQSPSVDGLCFKIVLWQRLTLERNKDRDTWTLLCQGSRTMRPQTLERVWEFSRSIPDEKERRMGSGRMKPAFIRLGDCPMLLGSSQGRVLAHLSITFLDCRLYG